MGIDVSPNWSITMAHGIRYLGGVFFLASTPIWLVAAVGTLFGDADGLLLLESAKIIMPFIIGMMVFPSEVKR